ERAVARSGAEVEGAPRRGGERRERSLVRLDATGRPPQVPARREPLELEAERLAEEPPQRRPPYGRVGREAGEAPRELVAAHGASRWIRNSCPGSVCSIAPASPPLIAIETER